MAWEKDLFTVPGLEANGDISTKQFYCFKVTTTNKRIVICGDGDIVDGILQNKPDAAGDAAELRAIGVTKVEVGTALTAGDLWGSDPAGKAKPVTAAGSAGDVGDYVAGRVIEGAAAGELAVVTIGFPTLQAGAA